MDKPDAAWDFLGLKLRPQGRKPVLEARFGQQVFPEFWQLPPPALGVQGQTLARELHRAGHEVAIRGAPVHVAEGIVADVVHAAEHEAGLPVNLAIQIDAPLADALVEVGGNNELRSHGWGDPTGARRCWRPRNRW